MNAKTFNGSVNGRLKKAVYVLILISTAAFAYMESRPEIFMVACAAMLVSWLLVESPKGRPAPQWLLNIVVLLGALYFWYEIVGIFGQNLVIALGHFMIILTLCKLFENKSTRDLTQIMILTFFLTVASTMMFSSNLIFAAILGGFLAVVLYTTVLFNLRYLAERYALDKGVELAVPTAGQGWRLGQDLRRLTWQSSLLLLPLAAVAFVMIPRSRTNGFLNGLTAGAILQTGYSDLAQFHEFGTLTESSEVFMTVALTRHNSRDNLGSEIFQPYFRGQALDTYDGSARQWRISQAMVATFQELTLPSRRVVEFIPPTRNSDPSLLDQEYTIYDTKSDTTMFTLAPNPPSSVYLYDEQKSKFLKFSKQSLAVRTGAQPTKTLHYKVSSLAQPDPSMYVGKASVPAGNMGPQVVPTPTVQTDAAAISNSATVAPGAAAATPVDPSKTAESATPSILTGRGTPRIFVVPDEIKDLARKIALDLLPANPLEPPPPENIRQIMSRFENYLRINYPYALNSVQVQKGLDPIVDFLLHRQKIGGNCEYFASAMVMLCRSVGINARAVAGFLGTEFNNVSMEYVVRMKDAHMWAEVYVPDAGWVLSDPSPIRMAVGASSWPVGRWAQDVIQAIENLWLSAVVSFDNDSRAAVAAWMMGMVGGVYDWVSVEIVMVLQAYLGGVAGSHVQQAALMATLMGVPLVLWWFGRRVWRDHRLMVMGVALTGRHSGRLSGEYAFMDELFSMVGHSGAVRRPDQTPREFAEQHQGQFGTHVGDAQWLVNTYYALRYGTLRADAKLRSQIASVVRQVREGVRQAKHHS